MNNSLLKKWKFMNNLHLTLTKKFSYLQIILLFCTKKVRTRKLPKMHFSLQFINKFAQFKYFS